jgi:hypothetical protein
MKRRHTSILESLIHKLQITDLQTELPPLSPEEKIVVKIQLLAAQIILRDAQLVKDEDSSRSLEELFKEFSQNWRENIEHFANALYENDKNNR